MRAIRARELLPLSREITLFPYLNEPRERASERANERTSGGRVSTRYRMFAFSLGRLRHPTEILKKLFLSQRKIYNRIVSEFEFFFYHIIINSLQSRNLIIASKNISFKFKFATSDESSFPTYVFRNLSIFVINTFRTRNRRFVELKKE